VDYKVVSFSYKVVIAETDPINGKFSDVQFAPRKLGQLSEYSD